MLGRPVVSPPSLRQNFAWVFAGSLTLALSQFGTQIVITKLGADGRSGIANLGTWSLGLAVTGPVFVFALLKLRSLQTSDQQGQFSWSSYATVRVLGMIGALLITAGIVAVRYRSPTGLVIAGIALMKAFEGGSDLAYGQLQRREQLRPIALSQIGRALSTLAAAAASYATTRSLEVTALVSAAVYGGWMVIDLLYVRRRLGVGGLGGGPEVRALLRMCAPLGMVGAIGALQTNIPRYFIEGTATRAELGVFAAVQYVVFMGSLVITAIGSAAMPRLARHVAAGEWMTFARLVRTLVLIGVALGSLGVVASLVIGRPLLALLYSDEVAAHHDVLVWNMATTGLAWTFMFLGTSLDAMRRYRIQPWIHGISSVIIAVAAWILVPRHRVLGATWALSVGIVFETICYFVAVAIPLRAELRRRHAS